MKPRNKFRRIVSKLIHLKSKHKGDKKGIQIDNNLATEKKWKLLKVTPDSSLKNFKDRKRKQFILAIIAAITFTVGTNLGIFA